LDRHAESVTIECPRSSTNHRVKACEIGRRVTICLLKGYPYMTAMNPAPKIIGILCPSTQRRCSNIDGAIFVGSNVHVESDVRERGYSYAGRRSPAQYSDI
jgi:hypothetical protein